MPLYETTFIARQDLSRQDVQKLADNFSGIITGQGGKVVKAEHWGLRSLAYRINKNRKGHYVMLAIDAPFAAVAEMQRQMRLSEEIIRSLTVRVDAIEEGASPMMSLRSSREDSPGTENYQDDAAEPSAA